MKQYSTIENRSLFHLHPSPWDSSPLQQDKVPIDNMYNDWFQMRVTLNIYHWVKSCLPPAIALGLLSKCKLYFNRLCYTRWPLQPLEEIHTLLYLLAPFIPSSSNHGWWEDWLQGSKFSNRCGLVVASVQSFLEEEAIVLHSMHEYDSIWNSQMDQSFSLKKDNKGNH